jgi:indolepyruvate ferredoxin oxidoreductase
MSLDELIRSRTAELAAYQDRAYADRYARRIEALRAAETPFGSEALTRAAAINLFRLMAIKDEYEVARLYADGRFAASLAGSFAGGRAKVWLAPPILAPKDASGRPRKVAFGGWMLRWGFPALARLKRLRGGPLDLFGHMAERREERALLAGYEAALDRIASGLSPGRLEAALRIARAPDQIRGFGHVKAAAIEKARSEEASLWRAWDAAAAAPRPEPAPL